MGFFDSLFEKALPHSIADLDYKVSTRNSTGFDTRSFEVKLNSIGKVAIRLEGSKKREAIDGLRRLSENRNLDYHERMLLNDLLERLIRY